MAVGLFSGAGFTMYDIWRQQKLPAITAEHMKALDEAILRFVIENGRYPCPAALDAPMDSPTFGLEVSADCTGDHPGTFRAPGRDGRMIRTGAAPVRSLSIDDEFIVDGWRHRLVYAVTEAYAMPGAALGEDLGAISVQDGEGNMATSVPGNLAYLLLSPGSDTRGAYSLHGALIDPCDDTAKAGINCAFQGGFLNTLERIHHDVPDRFSHRIVYGTSPLLSSPACDDDDDDDTAYDGTFCLLALQNFSKSGSGNINSNSCGIAANLDMNISGSGSLEIKDAYIGRDLSKSGSGDLIVEDLYIGESSTTSGSGSMDYIIHDELETERPPVPDPYADLEVPNYETCVEHCSTPAAIAAGLANGTIASATPVSVSGSSETILSPGVYCGGVTMSGSGPKAIRPGTFCGGLSLSGSGNVTFSPGLYVIDGGDFSKSGSGSLMGSEVAFVLTSSSGDGNSIGNVNLSGSGGANGLTAPVAGELAGVLFYQDRNATGSSCNSMSGSGGAGSAGTYYFPSRCLDMSGSGGMPACTRIVAQNISKSGSGELGNNCVGVPVRDIGWPVIPVPSCP